jgi:hypothetical protein
MFFGGKGNDEGGFPFMFMGGNQGGGANKTTFSSQGMGDNFSNFSNFGSFPGFQFKYSKK